MNRDIIIIYPPGTGGHHIANLISTSSGYTPRLTLSDYQYLDKTAHVPESISYQLLIDNIKNKTPGPKVLSGHIGEWIWAEDTIADYLNDPLYLIIEMYPFPIPKIVKDRIQQLWPPFSHVGYFQETATLYRLKNFKRLSGLSDIINIEVKDIFQNNSNYLCQLLENKLGITLDNSARQLHDQWYLKIVARLVDQ